jgi:Sel1 repeat
MSSSFQSLCGPANFAGARFFGARSTSISATDLPSWCPICAFVYPVPQDYAEALRWGRRAADQGDALAQRNLGNMYYSFKGVPHDYVRAYMWFNLAATQGDKDAIERRDKVPSLKGQ